MSTKSRKRKQTQERLKARVTLFDRVPNDKRRHSHHKPGSQNPHKQGGPGTR